MSDLGTELLNSIVDTLNGYNCETLFNSLNSKNVKSAKTNFVRVIDDETFQIELTITKLKQKD